MCKKIPFQVYIFDSFLVRENPRKTERIVLHWHADDDDRGKMDGISLKKKLCMDAFTVSKINS